MKLSERISSGDISQEVVEAVAVALGWGLLQTYHATDIWIKEDGSAFGDKGCPNYLTDIRLTLDEIERRGWLSSHEMYRVGCDFTVYDCQTLCEAVSRHADRNLTLAAITALLRALGE